MSVKGTLRLSREAAAASLSYTVAGPVAKRLLPLLYDDNNVFFEHEGVGWWSDGYMAVGLPGASVPETSPAPQLVQQPSADAAFEISREELSSHLPGAPLPDTEKCATCGGTGEVTCSLCDGTCTCTCDRCEAEHECGTCGGTGDVPCRRCKVHPLRQDGPILGLVALAVGGSRHGFDGRKLWHGLQVFPAQCSLTLQVLGGGDILSLQASTGERLMVAAHLLGGEELPTLVLEDSRATWAPAPAVEA